MIGNLTIDKASMNISYFLNTIRILKLNDDSMLRRDFVQKMADFLGVPAQKGGKESRTPYNKSKLPRYFGFVDIEKDSSGLSNLVLTNRGKKLAEIISERENAEPSERFYISNENRDKFIDLLIDSIIFESFGKNNCGAEQSNTDVEPPKVVFRTICELGSATAEEICFVMYGLNFGEFNSFEEAIIAIQKKREVYNYDYSRTMEDWKITNIVNDCKIINLFTSESIKLLVTERDNSINKVFYKLSPDLSDDYISKLSKLDVIYQPLRLLLYSDKNIESADSLLENSVLGGVSNYDYVFEVASEYDSFLGNTSSGTFNPGCFEKALLKAFSNPHKNVYIIARNTSEAKFIKMFDKYTPLLDRIDDLSSEQHGWSKTSIEDYQVYSYLTNKCPSAKSVLEYGKVIIPSNIQMVGTVAMKSGDGSEIKFDYVFKKALINDSICLEHYIPTDEEYNKFKGLISFFVNQLNINNDVIPGNKKYGMGFKDGSSLRPLYADYRDYRTFTLDCRLRAEMPHSPVANYITKTDTSLNINPHFDETNRVSTLALTNYGGQVDGFEEEYSVDDLALDSEGVNSNVKQLFNNYLRMIEQCESKEAEKANDSKGINDEKTKKDYTIEDLGAILAGMYNNATIKSTAIHMFGIKYGDVIIENDYPNSEIIKASGITSIKKDGLNTELNKGLNVFKSIKANEFGVHFTDNCVLDAQEILTANSTELPIRSPRTVKIHPLNFIIYGAPGTGKTYSTAEYALAILENREADLSKKTDEERKAIISNYNDYIKAGRIVFTTFHQNYGYEEFIQGLRPDKDSEVLSFKVVDGVLKTIADRAIEDNENNYVIIIDEINRANISKVFGELITLIEDDKRWGELNETSATLQSGDVFAVPNNLYIVGTMNSADKSISLIDAALRRRFSFIEQRPVADLVANNTLRKILVSLNTSLVSALDGTDLLIGHSYFMNKSENELSEIMNNSIIPLLYEYFYDDKRKVLKVVAKAIDDAGAELTVIDDSIGRLRVG